MPLRTAIQRLVIGHFDRTLELSIDRIFSVALDAGAHNITVEANTETYVLVVSDNGCGIPSSEVANVAKRNCRKRAMKLKVVVNNY